MALFVKKAHLASFNARIMDIRAELSLEKTFISKSLYTGMILNKTNWSYDGLSGWADPALQLKWCSGNPSGNQVVFRNLTYLF